MYTTDSGFGRGENMATIADALRQQIEIMGKLNDLIEKLNQDLKALEMRVSKLEQSDEVCIEALGYKV